MKTLTVRLPDALAARITSEARERNISKSDLVRERLEGPGSPPFRSSRYDEIADLVGAVEGLPRGMSQRRKRYLKSTGYGRKRSR